MGEQDRTEEGPGLSVDTLVEAGRIEEAERVLRRRIASGGADHTTFCSLAALCGMTERLAELRQLIDRALALQPDCPEAYNHLGNAHRAEGDLEAAVACFRQALAFDPAYADARNNLGIVLQEKGDLDAAVDCLRESLRLRPDYPEAHCNLGLALQERGDLEAAIDAYSTALRQRPDLPQAHFNLANAHRDNGDLVAALSAFTEALRLQPDFPEAAYNLSTLLLSLGNYPMGWEGYESRFTLRTRRILPCARPRAALWDGRPLDPGDRLLIVAEQGLGDALQFVRYALPLRRQGVEVSVAAPPSLHGLLAASGITPSLLTPEQADAVMEGYWIPLLSLPRWLGVSPANPILTEPYLRTTDLHRERWRQVLAGERRPIIALNWQGNPEAETTSLRGRSLPLDCFAGLAARSRSSLLSLQKGHGSEQLERCPFRHRFVGCQEQVSEAWDFLDTAAIVAHCDLVLTSDTSVAHLAAGMGVATWLLLHSAPDWRWGLEGETSFWYPSLRLFRQREAGNWTEVLERVTQEIEAMESLMTQLGAL